MGRPAATVPSSAPERRAGSRPRPGAAVPARRGAGVALAVALAVALVVAAAGCRPSRPPGAAASTPDDRAGIRLPSPAEAIAATRTAGSARLRITVDRPGAGRLITEGVTSFVERRAAMTSWSSDDPSLRALVSVTPEATKVKTSLDDEWMALAPADASAAGRGWVTPLDQLAAGRATRKVGTDRVEGDPATRYEVALPDGRSATLSLDPDGRIRRLITIDDGARTDAEIYDFGTPVPETP